MKDKINNSNLSNYFHNKKGQIGIFVIISLIIVVIGITYFTINSDSIKIFNNDKSSYKVKEFVVSCMNLETKDAINKIALHGGWLYSPYSEDSDFLFGDKDTNKYLIKNMKGYKDIGGVKIPYWYYYDDSVKKFKTNIPEYDSNSKYSIKNQIKRYLVENIDKKCFRNFEVFKDYYKIKYNPKDLNVNVNLERDNVEVNLHLPLEIYELNSNNTEHIEDFNIKRENKLWVSYNLARDIIQAEINSSFVEKRILNFIAPYQSANRRDLLPPFYEYSLKYDFRPWKIPEVEKLFKEILSSNINYIQFLNTNYKEHKLNDNLKDSKFAKALNQIYTKDYLSENSLLLHGKNKNRRLFENYRDYNVETNYESFFPTYFSISPSMGDMILMPRPEAVINLIPIFFTEYVAVYEITTPILFKIRKTHENDNFLFNLAFEANIDHNTPLAENKNYSFNFNKLNLNPDKSLICNPIQRVSAYIYLNITDPIDHGKRKYVKKRNSLKYRVTEGTNGIDGAMVTFNCKGLNTCYIGTTKINSGNSKGNLTKLKFRLPINCNPGKLEISKFGYQKLDFNINPELDKDINLGSVIMSSSKIFNLSVKLLSNSDSRYSIGSSLHNNETGFIILKNKENPDFVRVVEINKTNQYKLNVELLPGNYSVKAFIIYNKKIHIPSKRICYKKGLFSSKKCEVIPEMNMSSWVKGGLDLDNFEVPVIKMLYNNRLTIPLVNYGIPHSFEELERISNDMKNLKAISNSRRPYFEYR